MKILALIPARGGSKRLPGKNIRALGGKPLIVWSIEVAQKCPEVSDVLVSTDDPAIAAIAKNAGAFVPWLRPAELATDSAGSVDVALHALDWFEAQMGAVDGLLLLQPTSPFRSRETVLRGIELYRSHERRTVIGISHAASHPLWCFQIKDDVLEPFIEGSLFSSSQELPPAYVVNGAFYLISPGDLRAHRTFFGPGIVPLLVDDPQESIDIDTKWDWKMAEALLQVGAK